MSLSTRTKHYIGDLWCLRREHAVPVGERRPYVWSECQHNVGVKNEVVGHTISRCCTADTVQCKDTKQKRPRRVSRATSFWRIILQPPLVPLVILLYSRSHCKFSFNASDTVQRHGSSCRSFSGSALSTMSSNIEGYSQVTAEIVSTFAHGHDVVWMQETHIGPEYCRPCIHGVKLISETRHRKYGSAV